MTKGSNNMKLNIENFAKITNANININGITVIAGENNTGKSTIGKIVYSMFACFNDMDAKIKVERKRSIFRLLFKYLSQSFEDLDKICQKIIQIENPSDEEIKKIIEASENDFDDDEVVTKIKEYLLFEDEELMKLIVKKIFNAEFNNQIHPIGNESLESKVEMMIQEDVVTVDLRGNDCIVSGGMKLNHGGILIDNPFLIDNVQLGRDYHQEALFNFILDKDNDFTHTQNLNLKLSKSLLDNDNSLIDNALLNKRLSKFLEMLRETVRGDFVERDDKFLFLDENNKEIELSNLSTGIKSFAILMKLLENGDIGDKSIIVLDEPEVHLHPKWQLKYAELLILLQIEFDMNIILTTHSPYFINAIEVYSKKYGSKKRCNYYLAEQRADVISIQDVTASPNLIYKLLAMPFQILENEEDQLADEN